MARVDALHSELILGEWGRRQPRFIIVVDTANFVGRVTPAELSGRGTLAIELCKAIVAASPSTAAPRIALVITGAADRHAVTLVAWCASSRKALPVSAAGKSVTPAPIWVHVNDTPGLPGSKEAHPNNETLNVFKNQRFGANCQQSIPWLL